MFNLENAIQNWKRSLKRNPSFEEGQIKEMETHLRDEIDELIDSGCTEKEAFNRTVEKFGTIEEIGDEVYKTKTTNMDATPPWKQRTWLPNLLPNYIKITFRNMSNYGLQSAINIFGLAVGLACCILIFLFVRHELSYDTFHRNHDDIYLLTYREIDRPGARFFSTTSPPMGPKLQDEFPEIRHAVRLRDSQNNVFTHDNRRFYEDNIFYADSSFFQVFTFPLKLGNPETALARPNTVVLTQETARKYFGDENPIGNVLIMDGNRRLEVTGVLEKVPSTTHLPISLLISFETFRVPSGYPVTLESWEWVSFHTYLRLQEGTDPKELESKMPEFLTKYRSEAMADRGRLLLQPITDIYLDKEPRNNVMNYGNAAYAYGMGGIALLILLIACFNYMNISTAQSLNRGKEAGIRKVLGSSRNSLFGQFLGESVIKAIIALGFAVLLVGVSAHYFTNLFGFDISISLNIIPGISVIFLLITLAAGIAGSIYPALVISNYKPGEVLKGKLSTSRASLRVRNILMTLQFAISIGLIVGSLGIMNQIDYLQTKELGFNKDQTISLKVVRDQFEETYPLIKEQLEKNAFVESVTAGDLFAGGHGSVPVYPEGFDNEEGYPMNLFGVKYGFFETMDITVEHGRAFSDSFASDSVHGVMLNQAAVDLLGWENPIGKRIRISDIVTEGEVIGITENFHFASLHNRIQPLAMFIPRANLENILVRIGRGSLQEIMSSLEKDWQKAVPGMPFSFTFLDASVERLYHNEERFAQIVLLFTGLSIFIACIGLYGLVSISIQYRMKEIGIRKVLGARVRQIARVLAKPYLDYILMANLIAWPLSWWVLNQWLNNFAYRIDITIWIFIIAAIIVITIALLTLGGKIMKAVSVNPVETLRNE